MAKAPTITTDRKNANKGTQRGEGMLERSLRQYGAGRSVLIDKHGALIAGNKTAAKAMELGIPIQVVETDGRTLIAVKRTDLDLEADPAAKELGIADNRVSEVSLDWDPDVLRGLADDGVDLSQFWFDDELDVLLATLDEPVALTDPDAVPEPPKEPVTKPGDLWLLGRHRLLCGDSTVATDVARLMGDEKADLVWTDPPYGVAVGDKNKWLNSVGRSNRIERNLENDTLDEGPLLQMLRDAFSLAATYCPAGAAWYVAAPPGPLHLLFGQALKELGIWRQTIQWVKNNATFAPLGVTYHWQAEPIFYGWLPGAAHNDFTDRKQTTVWNVDRPTKSPEHPTMKPVELVTRAIEHSTQAGAVVLDMFGGSGTTLIAAEGTNRAARLIELDPKYCDVCVARFEQHTGRTATLERRAD